jgi:hypothetical protein
MNTNTSLGCFLSLCIVLPAVSGCSGSSSDNSSGGGGMQPPPAPSRNFALGFTPWPYDATVDAVNFVYAGIAARGDIIAHHLDGGIPWQEALDQAAYPAAVESELNSRLAQTPANKRVYLAINPFNGARDNLADYWDTQTNQPLPPIWAARDFDSPEVIQAYINFAKDLIARFDPEYFNLGIEVSELAINNSARFDKYITFAEQVTTSLKADYPDLKLMISVAMKSPGSASAAIINTEMPRVIQYIDVVGASIYPYVFFDHPDKGDPANLPADWLSQLQTIANGKAMAVAETGWIAERLEIPLFGVDVFANESQQNAYLQTLFDRAQALQMEFVIWFSLVDFDALWSGVLAQDPVAKIWRDTGLYDENLNARMALATWQQQLEKNLNQTP